MKLAPRQEAVRGLFVLIVLMGCLQLMYIYPGSDIAPHRKMIADNFIQEDSTNFTRPTVALRMVYPNQGRHHFPVPKPVEYDAGLYMGTLARISGPKMLPLSSQPDQFLPPLHNPIIFGKPRSYRGFLTIGIPSIRRPNTEDIYLFQTLDSLIDNTDENSQRDITVVVLLSDLNETFNDGIARILYKQYSIWCDSGFIQIIKVPTKIYPDFTNLKRTVYDAIERVQWRSKQNIDFAYLCLYSRNISEFYIQLEDDVLTARNFYEFIRNYIEIAPQPWFMLEFSRLGFIGKLFKNSDLSWVAKFLLFNFDSSPGDLLIGKMLKIRGQASPFHSQFSVFQHNGKFSSLRNKMMPSIDSKFIDADKISIPMTKVPRGILPNASVETNFEIVDGYAPNLAYDGNSSTYFWAKKPKAQQFFILIFKIPQNLTRIIISTGDVKRKEDSLLNSLLLVSVNHRKPKIWLGHCGEFSRLAEFVDGEIDTKAMGVDIPKKIKCLKIQTRRASRTWVKIREIVLL